MRGRLPTAAGAGRSRLPHARRQPASRHLNHRLQHLRQRLPHPPQNRLLVLLQPAVPPAGLILHTAGPLVDGGWRVFDVWESEEAFWQFFDERLLPAARELGQDPPESRPEFFAVHNMIGRGA